MPLSLSAFSSVPCSMNFLAHLYLSGAPGEVMVGNFIADSIRSSMHERYSPEVRKGILLHQAIDRFTDQHPLVEKSKERLRDRYHKYAGVITDVFYDHFLAKGWRKYASMDLEAYAESTYRFLGSRQELFPPRARLFYGYMTRNNVLLQYREVAGIARVMKGMSDRARFDSGMETCTDELRSHYSLFQSEFDDFFPQLADMCRSFRLNESQ